MQRFNTLLTQPELITLTARNKEAEAAQKIWEAIAPDNLASLSRAGSIKNRQFTVFAVNNAVAAKIKLLIPSLLIQLEKRECEVTAIRVKVQVKSRPKATIKIPRTLSSNAANSLKSLAQHLGESPLATKLNSLARKQNS